MRFLTSVVSAIAVALCVFVGLLAAVVVAVFAALVFAFWRLTGRRSPDVTVRDLRGDHLWRKGNPINVTPTDEPAAPQLK